MSKEKHTYNNTFFKQDTSLMKFVDYNLDARALTITGLLRIKSDYIEDTVSLFINKAGLLQINYTDSSISKTIYLKGKLSRRGYFQYFAKRKVIQIPPILPIIFGIKEVDRLRLAISKTGDLIIQNKYITNRNILLFGGGGRYDQLFYYKLMN